MHVIVTGGAGYVGCCLVPRLLELGHQVTVVDKLIFGSEGLAPVASRIELVACDIRRLDDAVLRRADAVIHLAGLSNDPTAEYDPRANRAINFEATVELATRAKELDVPRFVFASSCSVYYSPTPDGSLRDESHPVLPEAPYSWSKRQAEKALVALADARFCPVILRKGTVFGQSERMRYDLVVNTFTKDAFSHRRLVVHAGGRMWRPMLGIDDAVRAYVAALDHPAQQLRGEIFNVLSGNFTVLELASQVRVALERHRGVAVELEIQEVGVARSYRVDGTKLERELDLKMSSTIEESVRSIWDAIEQGIDVTHPIHYNIRWLEQLCDAQRRLERMGGSIF
jgi:nucleoside-diphosphate-sugar epimerase